LKLIVFCIPSSKNLKETGSNQQRAVIASKGEQLFTYFAFFFGFFFAFATGITCRPKADVTGLTLATATNFSHSTNEL